MKRPVVLTFVRHYLPGYKFGGPVRTIANMVEHLGDDLEFRIITSDRDVSDTTSYPNCTIDQWSAVGKAWVNYLSPRSQSINNFARILRETDYDWVYLNSFFDPVFTLRPLLGRMLGRAVKRQVVIAPRGEFSQGALALKPWKKKAYLALVQALGLYRNLTWQASSAHEAEDIRRVLWTGSPRIVVAPNLPPLDPPEVLVQTDRHSNDEVLRIVFVSRITAKKNLDFTLRVLAQVATRTELHVYGPISDMEYWRRCEALIAELPSHISVQYHGSVPPDSVVDVFASYDLFCFPTRGENFGHVILESLTAGTPVLLSDQTPWAADEGGGCVVRALSDMSGFVAAIEEFARLTAEEKAGRRLAARAVARAFTGEEQLREANLALFK